MNTLLNTLPIHEIMAHPAFGVLLFCVLSLPPLALIFWRTGLSPLWAGLMFASLAVPFLGLALALGVLGIRAWPKLPPPPKPAAKIVRDFAGAGEEARADSTAAQDGNRGAP